MLLGKPLHLADILICETWNNSFPKKLCSQLNSVHFPMASHFYSKKKRHFPHPNYFNPFIAGCEALTNNGIIAIIFPSYINFQFLNFLFFFLLSDSTYLHVFHFFAWQQTWKGTLNRFVVSKLMLLHIKKQIKSRTVSIWKVFKLLHVEYCSTK